jgi:hypothetical protein
MSKVPEEDTLGVKEMQLFPSVIEEEEEIVRNRIV